MQFSFKNLDSVLVFTLPFTLGVFACIFIYSLGTFLLAELVRKDEANQAQHCKEHPNSQSCQPPIPTPKKASNVPA